MKLADTKKGDIVNYKCFDWIVIYDISSNFKIQVGETEGKFPILGPGVAIKRTRDKQDQLIVGLGPGTEVKLIKRGVEL